MTTMARNSFKREIPVFPAKARWIWLPEQEFPNAQATPVSYYTDHHGFAFGSAVFRQKVTLPERLDDCRLLVTGDSKYRLFVNGEIVCDGPPEIGGDWNNQEVPDWFFYESYKVAAPFRSGVNEVVAEVMPQGDSQCDYSTGHGGFRLALLEGDRLLLGTDENWECRFDTGRRPERIYFPEREPVTWTRAQYLAAAVSQRWKLRYYPLPPLAVQEVFPDQLNIRFGGERISGTEDFLGRRGPLVLRHGSPVTFALHFPTEVAGCAEFEMESAPGARLTVRYQEVEGFPHEYDEYCTNGGRVKFRFHSVEAVLWLEVSVVFASFGYEGYDDVRLYKLSMMSQGFPLGEAAPFHSADSSFSAIRKCCENTLRMCMQRLHWDSPVHKEGLGCLADYRINALQSYYLFGESRLMRLDLIRIALLLCQKQHLLFHTTYNALFPVMICEYILYSGDHTILEEPEIPQAVALVFAGLHQLEDGDGMLTRADNYMFLDWRAIGDCNYHHPDRSNGAASLTAFFALGLQAGVRLAEWQGTQDRAEQLRRAYNRIQENFHRHYFDAGRRRYRNGPDTDNAIPQTGILAILAGLAPQEIAAEIIDDLCDKTLQRQVQPYFCHYLFDALAAVDAYDRRGSEVLHLWDELVAEHPESLKECWDCGDYSHSWSGTPAIQFGKRILGVIPEAPGFAACRIAPKPCGLPYAAGSVPTPHGEIGIEWTRTAECFQIRIQHPRAVKIHFCPPDGYPLENCILKEKSD